jgi:hypothetical protein
MISQTARMALDKAERISDDVDSLQDATARLRARAVGDQAVDLWNQM